MKAEGFSVDDRRLVENYGYGSSNYSPNYGYGGSNYYGSSNYSPNYGYGSSNYATSNYATNYGYGSSNYSPNYGYGSSVANNYGVTGGTRRLSFWGRIQAMVKTIKEQIKGTESGPLKIPVKIEPAADNYG
jgi:hypothetical protein